MPKLPAGLATTQPTLLALVLVFALAAALGGIFCFIVLLICRRFHIVAKPRAHHIHQRLVPRLGGIGIFLAFLMVSLLFFRPANDYERHVYLGLIAAAVLVVIVMAIDDLHGLPPKVRLLAQTIAALIAMFPAGHGTLIEVLHNPLLTSNQGQTPLGLWIAIPFTWFWIVGMMNTINWIDGLDGLAGGVVTIAALVMAGISWLLGQPTAALLCAALAGATLGFLPLNWHPARLFMGDSGAMFLGLALAVLANVGGAKLATMLLLLGFPILDTARVILRRLWQGHSPLHFDRTHLHHRLLMGGVSERRIVLLYYGMTSFFGAVAIFGAYLQTRAGLWSVRLHIWRGFYLSVSEVPTLVGLALGLVLTQIIWRYATYRRNHSGLPPGASSAFHSMPENGLASGPPIPTETSQVPGRTATLVMPTGADSMADTMPDTRVDTMPTNPVKTDTTPTLSQMPTGPIQPMPPAPAWKPSARKLISPASRKQAQADPTTRSRQ